MEEIRSSHPSHLARLFPNGDQTVQSWGSEELGDVLRHQLAAPLAVDLKFDATPTAGPPLESPGEAPLIHFRDVLHHPSPPLDLLKRIKEFAKSTEHAGGAALPKEVATVLYYMAIVLARTRHGACITTLTPEAQNFGLDWALQQPWLDPEVRRIFESTRG